MRFIFMVGLYLVLTGYAITDVINTGERHPFRLHRALWILIIVVFPYVGAVVWIVLRRRGQQPKSRGKESRPPDDDPEYLRWVAQQQRRRRGGSQSQGT